MRYRQIAFIIGVMAFLGLASVSAAYAEDQPDVLTDEQRVLIISNCTDLQATLNRIHQSDALARYDQGQMYRQLADKLMAPLNQRIASNQLDGSNLVATTASYNTQYQAFYNAYKEYELSMRATMQIDCAKQPALFYDSLTATRKKRISVHEATIKLIDLAEQYKVHFTVFRASRASGGVN